MLQLLWVNILVLGVWNTGNGISAVGLILEGYQDYDAVGCSV
jgi:hypothetical protein